jgi:hypothetical protein
MLDGNLYELRSNRPATIFRPDGHEEEAKDTINVRIFIKKLEMKNKKMKTGH